MSTTTTHPHYSRRFILRQVYLHHLLFTELLFVFTLTGCAKQLVECLWILVDQLCELWILGGYLLKKGLNESWVFLNHLRTEV